MLEMHKVCPKCWKTTIRCFLVSLALVLSVSPATRGGNAEEGSPLQFTAPIIGGFAGTCSLSYQYLDSRELGSVESVPAIWVCTLSFGGTEYSGPGAVSVGGVLVYELCAGDSVVASGKAITGGMYPGTRHSFTDTLEIPYEVIQDDLIPRWRLTCGGRDMLVIRCGPVTRIKSGEE